MWAHAHENTNVVRGMWYTNHERASVRTFHVLDHERGLRGRGHDFSWCGHVVDACSRATNVVYVGVVMIFRSVVM